jgi:TPR repeat protein
LLYFGEEGVERDYARAAQLLERAADRGNARAQNTLGVMHENGFGVEQDLARAAALYEQSAEQGDPKAQSNLGRIHTSGGAGVDVDAIKACKWLTLGAEQGEVTARNLLADLRPGLTPAQVATAQTLIEEFKQRPRHASK